jgi:multiple sugar transport system substrate-binding protein
MTSKDSTSRRNFLKTIGVGVAGLAVGAVAGYSSHVPGTPTSMTETVTQSLTQGPAAQGATQKDRALAGVAALKAAGQIPSGQTLTLMHFAGTAATFTSSQQEWETATGVKLNLVAVPIESSYDKVMLEATGKTGAYDVFIVNFVNMGDYAASGVIVPLDDYVTKYNPVMAGQPDGYIYPTGVHTTRLADHIWALDIDTDTHTAYYRKSMMQDPHEQETFEKQFGYPLQIPQTWDQYHDVVSFFHRPSQGFFGSYEFRQLFWGYRNWNYRFACKTYPTAYIFDDNMHPLIDTPEGHKAAEQYVDIVKYSDPEITSIAWTENFSRYAAGKGFANINFPSLSKFCNIPSLSKIVGDLLYAIPPGDIVDSPLGQKVLLHRNTHDGSWSCYVSAYSKVPELAYLYTQFLTSPEIIPIASSAAGSFADPARYSQSISPTQVGPFPYDFLHGQPYDYVARTQLCCPGLTFQGANEYLTDMDQNLMAASLGQMSPADAMAKTATQWEAITDRIGRSAQMTQWQFLKSYYPLTSF